MYSRFFAVLVMRALHGLRPPEDRCVGRTFGARVVFEGLDLVRDAIVVPDVVEHLENLPNTRIANVRIRYCSTCMQNEV